MLSSRDMASSLGDLHASRPPWETGRPQPAIAALADAGMLRGRLLDVGCGTGEHTLLAAALGLDATGIDLAPSALCAARDKARERGLTARFLHHDALRVAELGEVFDTALDSLVLHAFDAATRAAYLRGLHSVLRPGGRLFVLCYSDQQGYSDQHAGEPAVPHQMSRDDIESCFSSGWTVDSIQATRCPSNRHENGVAAWLASVTATRRP